jgi:hypothetical protein
VVERGVFLFFFSFLFSLAFGRGDDGLTFFFFLSFLTGGVCFGVLGFCRLFFGGQVDRWAGELLGFYEVIGEERCLFTSSLYKM